MKRIDPNNSTLCMQRTVQGSYNLVTRGCPRNDDCAQLVLILVRTGFDRLSLAQPWNVTAHDRDHAVAAQSRLDRSFAKRAHVPYSGDRVEITLDATPVGFFAQQRDAKPLWWWCTVCTTSEST